MSANFRFWVFPFKDGLADVEWTVRPDGMYWADEDGYGMTDEDAISLHGKITPDGKPAGFTRILANTVSICIGIWSNYYLL